MAIVLMAPFASCTKEEVPEKPKNYFGVTPEGSGASKEAYYALFAGVVIVIGLVGYGLKKIRK